MPIIARVNDKKLEIFNNETFTIKEIQHSKSNILIIDEAGVTKNISYDMFQKLFYVAFCITIHKSQGSTFDHPYTIHEWEHPGFDARLKYVALSRTTKLENINVV
jgi:ATP-dependent exoDNAse (exonuclease V) alpha subunit